MFRAPAAHSHIWHKRVIGIKIIYSLIILPIRIIKKTEHGIERPVRFFVLRRQTMPDTHVTPPRTLREKLTQDRERLYETRNILFNAITELVGGAAVTSYTLQNRSVSKTRADLGSLRLSLKEIDDQIAEIEAMLSGRPQRQSTTNVYVNPTNCIPNWWAGR